MPFNCFCPQAYGWFKKTESIQTGFASCHSWNSGDTDKVFLVFSGTQVTHFQTEHFLACFGVHTISLDSKIHRTKYDSLSLYCNSPGAQEICRQCECVSNICKMAIMDWLFAFDFLIACANPYHFLPLFFLNEVWQVHTHTIFPALFSQYCQIGKNEKKWP